MTYGCKKILYGNKSLAIFLSPAVMSQTKLSLAGKIANLFLNDELSTGASGTAHLLKLPQQFNNYPSRSSSPQVVLDTTPISSGPLAFGL